MLATVWQLKTEYIHYQNIVEEWGLISAAWKWLGESEVHHVAVDPSSPKDDRIVIQELHKVLSEADVVVAHYGDRFDLPKFKARAVFHGLQPIPNIRTVDTHKVASRVFRFTSNRLDYLGKFLGVGSKIKTSHELWVKVMAGDERALERMIRYNKQDVRLLEKVYLKLRPYMLNHPNESLSIGGASCCPNCGSKKFQKRGMNYTRAAARQQYQCSREGCGAWFSGKQVARSSTR